jgi:hypothetical protein
LTSDIFGRGFDSRRLHQVFYYQLAADMAIFPQAVFSISEDQVRRCRPDEGPGVLIVMLHELIDLAHQFLHTAESSAPDGSLGDPVDQIST